MSAALPSKRLFLSASVVVYAIVFAAFVAFERPGLGIGHFYYLGIGLAALALGPLAGAAAGVVAVGSSRVDLQACKLEYSIVSPK